MPVQRHLSDEAAARMNPGLGDETARPVRSAALGRVLLGATAAALDGKRPELAVLERSIAQAAGLPSGSDATQAGEQALILVDALTRAADRTTRALGDLVLDALPASSATHAADDVHGLAEVIDCLTTALVIGVDNSRPGGQSPTATPWDWT